MASELSFVLDLWNDSPILLNVFIFWGGWLVQKPDGNETDCLIVLMLGLGNGNLRPTGLQTRNEFEVLTN